MPAADRWLRIGRPQILKNIKKGATVETALRITENCRKLGLVIHGDFIVGLPGETPASVRRTIDFAKRLDTETIQVSIAHPYPGTEFYDYVKKNGLITIDSMTDEAGHQLPNTAYPGLTRAELILFPAARDLARTAKGDFQRNRIETAGQGSARVFDATVEAEAVRAGAEVRDQVGVATVGYVHKFSWLSKAEVRGSWGTQMALDAVFNVAKEFWPDINQHVFHGKY